MVVLSTYGKGCADSVAINFSPSGGADCDLRCRFHPARGGKCYAARLEGHRPSLRNRLGAHESAGAETITREALGELKTRLLMGGSVRWLRLSSFGPVPKVSNVTPGFISALRELLTWAKSNGVPVHFPVESASKAAFYRSAVGDLCIIRQTVQSERGFLAHDRGPCAVTAGLDITRGPQIRQRRIEAARLLAKRHYKKTGRKTIVCPAEASDSPRAKCGLCDACANPALDIVYVLH